MTAPTSRVVRVFISSTFRDFGEERDLLMKRVFPELRRRARERFVEVIGVDLRWGITEEESQQGETLPICLREIERSRPYFIGLLGERYGWTPAAGQYPENLLAQQPWLAEHAGGKSVTELEILHGVLNSPEMVGRAYFYFRDAAWSEGKGADFRSEGADERAKLARLKERIRGSQFPVAEYPTPEAVADRITEDLWRLIDAEYPADAVPDELERVRRSHEAYALERRRLYVGQEETVAALLARLEQASDEKGEEAARTRTTLVTGESGTGKSALIANVLARYRERHPSHVVIEHYVGSTSDASDPSKLMRRIAGEIRKLTESSREIEDDPEKLSEQFAEWLAEASWWAGRNGRTVVISLDALDKLSGEERLRWLPKTTAPQLRIVLSSLEGESREVLEKRGVETLAARPFTKDVARAYIVETLARRGRKLPAREVERIVAHPRATLPIYLKTLVEELSVFGSYEDLPQRITECLAAQEPDDLFEVILARLEADLGEERVRKPLEAIWASADGMSDDELMGFTGVSPLELARLKLALDDALYESGGLVRLAHAYASKGVGDRYLPAGDARRALHRRLGLWWEKREPTPRMGYSVDLHLYIAEAWVDLERCLTSPRVAAVVLQAVDVYSVYRSWRGIANALGIESVGKRMGPAIESRWNEWIAASEGDGAISMLEPLRGLFEVLELAQALGTAELISRYRLELSRRVAAELGTPERLSDVSLSLYTVAGIEEARGDLDSAVAKYGESLEIRRRLSAELRTPGSLSDVSLSLYKVAGIEEARGNVDAALAKYVESMEISRRLAEELGLPWALRDLSWCRDKVAGIEEARGDLDAALAKYGESLEIRRRLTEALGTVESLRDVSVSLCKVAGIEKARGDLDAALAMYEESLEIARHLAEELGAPESLRDVSLSLDYVAGIEKERGDLDAALAKHGESLEIARYLAEELGTPGSLRDLSASLINVAGIEEARGDLDAALAKYGESLELSRRLAEQLGTPSSMRDLSVSLNKVAGIEEAGGDLDAALAKYEESLEIRRRLLKESGEPLPQWISDFQWSLLRCRDVAMAGGAFEAAYERAAEMMGFAQEEVRDDSSPRAVGYLLSVLRPLMTCQIELGRNEDAAESAEAITGLVAALVCAFKDPEVSREEQGLDSITLFHCADGLEVTARLLELKGDHQARDRAARDAAAVRESAERLRAEEDAEASAAAEYLVRSFSADLNLLNVCAAFHETSSRVHAGLGRSDEAAAALKRAAAIRARIRDLKGDGPR